MAKTFSVNHALENCGQPKKDVIISIMTGQHNMQTLGWENEKKKNKKKKQKKKKKKKKKKKSNVREEIHFTPSFLFVHRELSPLGCASMGLCSSGLIPIGLGPARWFSLSSTLATK
jgi:hypothetical protein